MTGTAELQKRGQRRRRAETTVTALPPAYRPIFTHSQNVVLEALVKKLPRIRRAVVSRRDLMELTGLSRHVVEDALRLARQIGLTREWQHKPGEEANTIEIVSPEWLAWIEEHMPQPAQKRRSLRK